MAKQQYTKEQKQAYFSQLRAEWRKAKETANVDEINAILMNHGLNISPISYALVKRQMNALNLSGIPYIDCKTYDKWRENGFQVQKGEKSQIHGITWITANGAKNDESDDQENDDSFRFPKVYNLFHRTQVQELTN